jgi:[ribosomal protein S18]-alanine N-acetyltransferase
MPIFIRQATLDDVPAILAIEQSAPSAAHWNAEQYQARLQQGFLLVAECDRGICGFLCARLVADECEIENVVVDEGSRRRGIGAHLIRALIERWQESAGTAVLLEVRESNIPARGLYEKCGLREVGRRREYYPAPIEDAILYTYHRNS